MDAPLDKNSLERLKDSVFGRSNSSAVATKENKVLLDMTKVFCWGCVIFSLAACESQLEQSEHIQSKEPYICVHNSIENDPNGYLIIRYDFSHALWGDVGSTLEYCFHEDLSFCLDQGDDGMPYSGPAIMLPKEVGFNKVIHVNNRIYKVSYNQSNTQPYLYNLSVTNVEYEMKIEYILNTDKQILSLVYQDLEYEGRSEYDCQTVIPLN